MLPTALTKKNKLGIANHRKELQEKFQGTLKKQKIRTYTDRGRYIILAERGPRFFCAQFKSLKGAYCSQAYCLQNE